MEGRQTGGTVRGGCGRAQRKMIEKNNGRRDRRHDSPGREEREGKEKNLRQKGDAQSLR